jgi:hypothetical protein
VRPEGGVVGADQLPFDDGVERLAILSQVDGSELASIDDPALVNAIVAAALQAPVEGGADRDWDSSLLFELQDGLRFRRTYNTATGYMREGVLLPEAARKIIRDALR